MHQVAKVILILIRFIKVFVYIDGWFLFMAEWYVIVWIYCSLFIHPPFEGHLGYFQLLTIINKAGINIHVQVFSRVGLCNPMDCSPPGSSVHRILQARILKLVAILFSRGFSKSRAQAQVYCIAGRFFTL